MKVTLSEEGITLLEFVKKHFALSGKKAKEQIDRGAVMLNGKSEKFGKICLHKGDEVLFNTIKRSVPSKYSKKRIILETGDFIAYDKPEGVVCSDAEEYFPVELTLVHRLDQFTTGVLILAKSSRFARKLENLFRDRAVEKEYWVLVDGVVEKNMGIIKTHLQNKWQNKWASSPRGFLAETSWSVLKRYKDVTLLSVKPRTGRTHQIRVHLSEMGHPVAGDYLYGKAGGYPHYLLHCRSLNFLGHNIIADLHQSFIDALTSKAKQLRESD